MAEPAKVHDPRFQRRYTVLFTLIYAVTLFSFIGLAVALFVFGDDEHFGFSADVREILIFIFGLVGPMVGFQTKVLGDHNQYHYGSSMGSKLKSPPEADQVKPVG